jgi:hypothetical protein
VRSNEFSKEEEELILREHKKSGNKWVEIALQLPGRCTKDFIL